MRIDGGQFLDIEKARVTLVAQNGEAGLFVQDFAAKWIDHADRAVTYRAHNRVFESAAFDQLADQYALIDQGDMEIPGHQAALAVLDLARVCDDALEAL